MPLSSHDPAPLAWINLVQGGRPTILRFMIVRDERVCFEKYASGGFKTARLKNPREMTQGPIFE